MQPTISFFANFGRERSRPSGSRLSAFGNHTPVATMAALPFLREEFKVGWKEQK